MAGAQPIVKLHFCQLDYRRVQILNQEITKLVQQCKQDPQVALELATTHREVLRERTKQLTEFLHQAKREQRPENVLIAKQLMRWRQLQNALDRLARGGDQWTGHQSPPPATPAAAAASSPSDRQLTQSPPDVKTADAGDGSASPSTRSGSPSKWEMNTFERLHMSSPKHRTEVRQQTPKAHGLDVGIDKAGDFRSILRGGLRNDLRKAWRNNYHTRVDVAKTTADAPLYHWEVEGASDPARTYSGHLTTSAEKTHYRHASTKTKKLREDAGKDNFRERQNIAFGRRTVPKEERARRAAAAQLQRKSGPRLKELVSFQVVMNESEYQLYRRLQLSIPLARDSMQSRAANEAARVATRRLSMHSYSNVVHKAWGGEPRVSQTTAAADGAARIKQAKPGAASASAGSDEPSDVEQVSKHAQPAARVQPHDVSNIDSTSLSSNDRILAAARASKQASQSATKRGSVVVIQGAQDGAVQESMLFRSQESINRELEHAKQVHRIERQHLEQQHR